MTASRASRGNAAYVVGSPSTVFHTKGVLPEPCARALAVNALVGVRKGRVRARGGSCVEGGDVKSWMETCRSESPLRVVRGEVSWYS